MITNNKTDIQIDTTKIPEYHETFTPILIVLQEMGTMRQKELKDAVMDRYYSQLPNELISEKTERGTSLIVERIIWGIFELEKVKMVEKPERGKVIITEKGQRIINSKGSYTHEDRRSDEDWLVHKRGQLPPKLKDNNKNSSPIHVSIYQKILGMFSQNNTGIQIDTVKIPEYHETFTPILIVLQEMGTMRQKELKDTVMDRYYSHLPNKLLSEKTERGTSLIVERIIWGIFELEKVKMIEKPERGKVIITEKGQRIMNSKGSYTHEDRRSDEDWLAHKRGQLPPKINKNSLRTYMSANQEILEMVAQSNTNIQVDATRIPEYHETFTPILIVLREIGSIRPKELKNIIWHIYNSKLPSEILNENTERGTLLIVERIAWGMFELWKANMVEKPAWGRIRISSKGQNIMDSQDTYTYEDIRLDEDWIAHNKSKRYRKRNSF